MREPHSSFVDADDVRLHYLEWDPEYMRQTLPAQFDTATDDIPVVLLHSLGATADSWRLTASYLYHQHYLLAFDLRGHGLSDQPSQHYDLLTMAEDVISGMAKLGLGQVAVVGHGWGARVALLLAARHPALVSHLILVDCPHVEPRHWPGMTRERFVGEEATAEIYPSRESYLQTWRSEMDAFWSPEVEEILLTYVRELPDGQLQERLLPEHQSMIRASLWEDRALSYYGKLTCPVLLVPAAAKPLPGAALPDRLELAAEFAAAKGEMVAQVARAIQRCSVLWMPDTIHDIQLQRPRVLANEIARFLQE
ncbi:alpha/beta fold hydrolase [Dictyobacter arantiisoli]|uniref:Alpha/beta hydrolase n=1 Tax=Dictyobacter arantiisoli TaxID=2014874 RepID=A0A5A5TKM8_9CHLR|nr:alpha/beta hydrolase [Dictyobacter arantiisoli]GCF11825.1 alpha/beta hydrolase [Dictyobacter arantiisoli]